MLTQKGMLVSVISEISRHFILYTGIISTIQSIVIIKYEHLTFHKHCDSEFYVATIRCLAPQYFTWATYFFCLCRSFKLHILKDSSDQQAAILCQFLESIDYSTALRCLQERSAVDAMDAYYCCLWDVSLIEFIINMHHKRGEVQRRDKAVSAHLLHIL